MFLSTCNKHHRGIVFSTSEHKDCPMCQLEKHYEKKINEEKNILLKQLTDTVDFYQNILKEKGIK
jgi:hypothetical protein